MAGRKVVLGKLCSFYDNGNGGTISDWYRAYRSDTQNRLWKNGLLYTKIIARCEMTIGTAEKVLVFIDFPEGLKVGDVLLDENDNEYLLEGFEMIRLAVDVPDWYGKVAGVSLHGRNAAIGNYLTKKPDPFRS